MRYQLVVATKKAVNLSLPSVVMDEFDGIAQRLEKRQKWMAHTAAVLMLLEQSEDVRNYYIRRAGSADIAGGSFKSLVDDAKSGKLRDESPFDVDQWFSALLTRANELARLTGIDPQDILTQAVDEWAAKRSLSHGPGTQNAKEAEEAAKGKAAPARDVHRRG